MVVQFQLLEEADEGEEDLVEDSTGLEQLLVLLEDVADIGEEPLEAVLEAEGVPIQYLRKSYYDFLHLYEV